MKARRLGQDPIIHSGLHDSLGSNINGPSLIEAPEWLAGRLARYHLYFAHHTGRHIRLAYADELAGPWTVHPPGVLPLADSTCFDHVASPDVHLDHEQRRVLMYFHGVAFPAGEPTDGHERQFGDAARWIGNQRTKLATSTDGLHFEATPRPLAASYLRAFIWRDRRYAIAMPGIFYRECDDGRFEPGPLLFDARFRHAAVLVRNEHLHVFHTRVGDAPERILHTAVDLRPDWHDWRAGPISTVLAPEMEWEGALLPAMASTRGPVYEPVCQLRDPAIFVQGEQVYLIYTGAGEQAIGIAALDLD